MEPETHTIRDLCNMIKAHYDMDFRKVALICAGKDLWYDNTLAFYNITQESQFLWAVFVLTENQN